MLRLATPDDAAAVRAVYAPFVRETSITFEETVPDETDIRDRIVSKQGTYPWFVCELDGEVVGYAYAGALRKRAAYRWAVETSVYVRESAQGEGVGRALYTLLLDCLDRQGFCDVYAVVTVPNPRSTEFHARMGFERVAQFPSMGYKRGGWHDVEWWHRSLGTRPETPDEPLSVTDAKRRSGWEAAVERAESLLDR
jgi:phosphinothricin acetyltransferase